MKFEQILFARILAKFFTLQLRAHPSNQYGAHICLHHVIYTIITRHLNSTGVRLTIEFARHNTTRHDHDTSLFITSRRDCHYQPINIRKSRNVLTQYDCHSQQMRFARHDATAPASFHDTICFDTTRLSFVPRTHVCVYGNAVVGGVAKLLLACFGAAREESKTTLENGTGCRGRRDKQENVT